MVLAIIFEPKVLDQRDKRVEEDGSICIIVF